MTSTIFTFAHEATFAAYAIFAALVVLRSTRTWLSGALFTAIAATAVWAQVWVAAAYGLAPNWLEPVCNGLRDAGWLGLSLTLMYPRGGQSHSWRALLALAVLLIALQIGLDASSSDVGVIAGIRID